MYVKLISSDFGFLEATVTASNKHKQLLTLSFPTLTNTGVSALDYMEGSYYIEVEKFTGSIENITYYKENGQTLVDVLGRSDMRKLLGPIINKNTVHSKDMIYSSRSPFNRLEYVNYYDFRGSSTVPVAICSFDSKVVSFGC